MQAAKGELVVSAWGGAVNAPIASGRVITGIKIKLKKEKKDKEKEKKKKDKKVIPPPQSVAVPSILTSWRACLCT